MTRSYNSILIRGLRRNWNLIQLHHEDSEQLSLARVEIFQDKTELQLALSQKI